MRQTRRPASAIRSATTSCGCMRGPSTRLRLTGELLAARVIRRAVVRPGMKHLARPRGRPLSFDRRSTTGVACDSLVTAVCASWMRAIGHGVTALGRASGSGCKGERDEQGDEDRRWGGGVEASMLAGTRTPTVIRPSPYTSGWGFGGLHVAPLGPGYRGRRRPGERGVRGALAAADRYQAEEAGCRVVVRRSLATCSEQPAPWTSRGSARQRWTP